MGKDLGPEALAYELHALLQKSMIYIIVALGHRLRIATYCI